MHNLPERVLYDWRERRRAIKNVNGPPAKRRNSRPRPLVPVEDELLRFRASGKLQELLTALDQRRGRTVTRDELLDTLYGGKVEPGPKILDIMVFRLRRMLRPDVRIVAVWGVGYRLEVG